MHQNKNNTRDVVGFTGLYSITSEGKVFSHYKNRFISNCGEDGGYKRVYLQKDGKTKAKLVHRLVAEAFIENKQNKATVNHKDGIKDNNILSNLEWATHSENNQHGWDNGLMKTLPIHITNAKKNGIKNRKLSIDMASEICEAYATGLFTYQDIATEVGISKSNVGVIVRGESYMVRVNENQ